VIMSASKGIAALCVQILVDRGELDLDAPVTAYWPEFGQAGKESTLVRHVMLHTAGVIGFPNQTELLRFDGEGWDDYDAIAAGFAASAPEWPPGSKHAYHAMSFGWLVGELVRRVSGRSLGTFFRDEVGEPLGLEAWLGTPDAELRRVAQVYKPSTGHLPSLIRKSYEASLTAAHDADSLPGKAFLGGHGTSGFDELERVFNNPRVLKAEFPAGGATANARALARMWAMFAQGGDLDGVRVLSEKSVAAFGEVVLNVPDLLMEDVPMPRMLAAKAAPVPRTLGYLGNGAMVGLGPRFGPNPDAFGVEGLGGQFAFCDPESRVAVGYVRSDLAVVDVLQVELTRALYSCARALGHQVHTPAPPSRLRAALQGTARAYLRRKVAVPAVR
jgi:CubicO group peptidase (beta-lactamase class C family)